ncbi:cytochrome P450 [Sphingobium sp. YR768]|uniref:cytochrome P450 n=1 Tax=Sphingobium sp. YR768 TaxID=1884365 RepID=UPI0008B18604|nr:cytochrome P450 [Sphingobium sp. YR768]SES18062.1 Cytochrome P450 [Sphingobium sp. YR768]
MTQASNDPSALSFADPDIQRCPFPAYAKLRDDQPVYKDPVTGTFILTRHDDVRRALLNVKALRNDTGLTSTTNDVAANAIFQEKGWLPLDTLVSNDPPNHRVYRTLVDKVFTTARVMALEPRIGEIVTELIDQFANQSEIDFLDVFAIKLPMTVIAEQLGISPDHMDRFKRWSDVSVESTSPVIPTERRIEIANIITEMQRYLAIEIESVRSSPNNTLISNLANTDVDGRRLDMRELLSVIHQILVAGNETTTTALASGMRLLIERPELAELIYNDQAKVFPFIEETLRLLSPVQTLFRRAAEDVEIAGVIIPAGSLVEVRYGAANRDPKQYAAPDEINLDRTNAMGHLAFGAGIHMCIGNQLARGELKLAFLALTSRLKGFRLTRGENSYRWVSSYVVHGPAELWMSFERR